MFSSFFLPCSLFEILTSQGENTNFHPDRAPHRDCDHRDFSLNAPARPEQSAGTGTLHSVHEQSQDTGNSSSDVFR